MCTAGELPKDQLTGRADVKVHVEAQLFRNDDEIDLRRFQEIREITTGFK